MTTKLRDAVIFVTGDVHDMHMGGLDQLWLRKHTNMTEMQCAVKYAMLAGKYNIPVTLFVTGLAVNNEFEEIKTLGKMHHVEIGGHTWSAFNPGWRHLFWERTQGSYYGPRQYQEQDILKTLEMVEKVAGTRPISWRTHAYRGDETTFDILNRMNCRVVSDKVGSELKMVRLTEGLISLPINTPPDHEHLYHGYFTKEKMAEDVILRNSLKCILSVRQTPDNWLRLMKEVVKRIAGIKTPLKPFGEKMYETKPWFSYLKSEMRSRLLKNGFATLLLHPVDMQVLDGMKTLEMIFEYIAGYECAFVKDAWEIDSKGDKR
jgi:hypothetical protein